MTDLPEGFTTSLGPMEQLAAVRDAAMAPCAARGCTEPVIAKITYSERFSRRYIWSGAHACDTRFDAVIDRVRAKGFIKHVNWINR